MRSAVDYDIHSEDFFAAPDRTLERMQRCDPVWWDPRSEAFVLTRYDDISRVLRDPGFSVARQRRVPGAHLSPRAARLLGECDGFLERWLVFSDQPRHTALRAVARAASTRQTVSGLEEGIAQLAEDLLASAPCDQPWDMISGFAMPLAGALSGLVLGIPAEVVSGLAGWGEDLFRLFRAPQPDEAVIERAGTALRECREFFGALLAQRRRSASRDDFVSGIARADLPADDLVGLCVMFMAGTQELTGHAIGNSAYTLMHQSGGLGRFRDRLPSAIEEALRCNGPTFRAYREATGDFRLGETVIERGQRVFAILHAANHDPRVFPEPYVFRVRPRNRHMALGVGLHSCIAAPLVRLTARVALSGILRRSACLAPGSPAPAWIPNLVTRGLGRLDVACPVPGGAREVM